MEKKRGPAIRAPIPRPSCKYCGCPAAKKRLNKLGIQIYHAQCRKCMGDRSPYRRYKKTYCEICGFEGHYCQLDVDHKDGDHTNNDPSNLQTLCANCHRLKTWKNKDWK